MHRNRKSPAIWHCQSPIARIPGESSGASGGSLHGGASLKVEETHFAP